MDFTNPDNHTISSTSHLDTKVLVTCSCGAIWSESANANTDTILATLEAHKVYFNKPKIVTL